MQLATKAVDILKRNLATGVGLIEVLSILRVLSIVHVAVTVLTTQLLVKHRTLQNIAGT